MDISHDLKKMTTGALVSGAVAVAILGVATATAQADPSPQAHFSGAQGNRCRSTLVVRIHLPMFRGRLRMW
jgi:hypothetical protein